MSSTFVGLADEDYIGLFDSESSELPDLPAVLPDTNGSPLAASGDSDNDDWQSDPVPVKLDKIRSVFLNSKTASEVRAAAGTMQIGDWLTFATNMGKQVDAAPVQITAIRIELPPRSGYDEDNVVEVELAR